MKTSRRATRMARHHKRRNMVAGLNMVSLMDIFTILVFFLLVNSTEIDVLPSTKTLALPESHSEDKPRETVVILVNERDIVVQGRAIAAVDEVLRATAPTIPALRDELAYHTQRVVAGEGERREITIMGDKEIPYRLLRKIMLTCAEAKYTSISLAVMQKSAGEQG